MMKTLINSELLKIVVNSMKQRTYCTMQGFWQENEEKAQQLPVLLQQLSEQIPRKGTIVLDTTELRIMHPRVAEHFLPSLTECLFEKRIKALAHVRNPENVVVKMQFTRVLSGVEWADEVRHATFHDCKDAEQWLDMQH